MSSMSRAIIAALLVAATPASAAKIYVNDPTVEVTSIDTIVVGAKYRFSPVNFDQSLDSGGGTNNAPPGSEPGSGQPNFLSKDRGNFAALNGATFDFTFEHRAGQGFIFSMTNPAGATWTQAWGTFAPPVAADQSAAVLPALAATGQVPGSLIAPGLPFNALHLESRASLRPNLTGATVTYSDLTFTTPGLTQVGVLQTGFALAPGGGNLNPNFPDPSTDYHSQWFVADTNLALQDFTLAGKVRFDVTGYTGGNIDEFLKFNISGKQVAFTGGVVPEPSTWAMLIAGFGMVGVAVRRRREAALSA